MSTVTFSHTTNHTESGDSETYAEHIEITCDVDDLADVLGLVDDEVMNRLHQGVQEIVEGA